jgi:hypothetical protein
MQIIPIAAYGWDISPGYPSVTRVGLSTTNITLGNPFTVDLEVYGNDLTVQAVTIDIRSLQNNFSNRQSTNLTCNYFYGGKEKSGTAISSGLLKVDCFPSRRLLAGDWYVAGLQIDTTSCPVDQIGIPSNSPCTNGNDRRHFTQYFTGVINPNLGDIDLSSGLKISDDKVILRGNDSAKVISDLPRMHFLSPPALTVAPIENVSSSESQISFNYNQGFTVNGSPEITCIFTTSAGVISEISSFSIIRSISVTGLSPSQVIAINEKCISVDGMSASANYSFTSLPGTKVIPLSTSSGSNKLDSIPATSSILCTKGKSTKKVTGTKPKCPAGYMVKK